VNYLLKEVRRLFPTVKEENIYYTYAGLRSLSDTRGERPSDTSRAHKLIDHERVDGIKGFISVLGGKITGYRGIAEEITDMVCQRLAVKADCITAQISLPGAPAVSSEEIAVAAQESGLPVETMAYLTSLYGSRYTQILALAGKDSQGKQLLCPHTRDIRAQIWHAVNEESALTVSDFMLRRSVIGLMPCQGLDALETVANEMGCLLGWTDAERQRQIAEYRTSVALGQRFRMKTGWKI
jgi:glycerol-3-phosphate dehydrogenase